MCSLKNVQSQPANQVCPYFSETFFRCLVRENVFVSYHVILCHPCVKINQPSSGRRHFLGFLRALVLAEGTVLHYSSSSTGLRSSRNKFFRGKAPTARGTASWGREGGEVAGLSLFFSQCRVFALVLVRGYGRRGVCCAVDKIFFFINSYDMIFQSM